mgnify:CR=1 FL=1
MSQMLMKAREPMNSAMAADSSVWFLSQRSPKLSVDKKIFKLRPKPNMTKGKLVTWGWRSPRM